MRKDHFLILFLVCILTLLLRVYKLADIPLGFFGDEASIGYNAYTIYTSGADEYGVSFPLFFKAFGEYKSPIQIYATVPLIALFGLNEFSTRLTSAIYGTGSVIFIFLLLRRLLNYTAGFAAAILLAINPWAIHFSRIGFEASAYIFFTLAGLFLYVKSLGEYSRKRILFIVLTFVTFAIATYTYFPARIVIPLLVILLVVLVIVRERKRVNVAEGLLACLVYFLVVIPLVIHMLWGPGLSRWKQLVPEQIKINDQWVKSVWRSYKDHYSVEFLFIKGDIDFPGQFITRHSVKGVGQFYYFQAFLIVGGFIYFLKEMIIKKLKIGLGFPIIGFLAVLFPLPSALVVVPSPAGAQAILGVIPVTMLSAVGLAFAINSLRFYWREFWLRLPILLVLLVLVVQALFVYLMHFRAYPYYSSDFWGWQYGPRDILAYFMEVQNEYDELYMFGAFNGGEIFVPFYTKGTCPKCTLGDFNLVNYEKRQLFAIPLYYYTEYRHKCGGFTSKKVLYYPDGSVAFLIGECRR